MTWKWRDAPEVAYVWFHKPTGSAGIAEVRSHQGGVTCVGRGSTFLEGDTPPPVNRPLRWTSRTTAIVERLLFEQGWRVMTRREAVGALRNAGLPVPYRANPGSGHIIAQDVADDIRWTTDCEYDTCAFVVRLAAVPEPVRGSGATVCCGGHRDRCQFGRPHTWATWYQNGHLMRTGDTFRCHGCGGVCTADEASPPEYVNAAPAVDDVEPR